MKNFQLFKKRNFILGSLLISVLFVGFSRFDDEPLKKILQQIEKFRVENPQEKVHIHLDKPYYAIGDSIWFKAYVVDSEKNELTSLSQIMYVELIDDSDSVKLSLRLPLTYGMAWGDFTLADSLKEGNYRIRAYTNWMRNFDDDYFFDKAITIGNAITNEVQTFVDYSYSKNPNGEQVEADITFTDLDGHPISAKEVNYTVILDTRELANGKGTTDSGGKLKVNFVNTKSQIFKTGRIVADIKLDERKLVTKSIPIKSTSNQSDVQFFPESGNLVNGIQCKIGFKAVNAVGLGIPVSGFISTKDGNPLAEFKSEHAGMGSFTFRPVANESYVAHVTFEDGSKNTFPLPKVLSTGYVLNIDNVSDENQLRIKVHTTEFKNPDAEFTLVAQSNGTVLYVSKNPIDAMSFSASIPKSRFPTGILQLTLFSEQNQPVAERLVFINHQDFLNLAIKTPKSSYEKREKVSMEVQAISSSGEPAVGSFSVAITDESKISFDDNKETSILSNLLLSSDLKGFVEYPNYYFHEPDLQKAKHLDNLLLTQGWRRFEWKNILNDSFPVLTFTPESNLKISGNVKTASGRPVPGASVTLFSASETILLDAIADQEGKFVFDELSYSGTSTFTLQARGKKNSEHVIINVDRNPAHTVSTNKNRPLIEVNINRSIMPYLKESRSTFEELSRISMLKNGIVLGEVRVVDSKPTLSNSSNLNGPGKADLVLTSEFFKNCIDLPQCLQSRVAGIEILNGIAYASRYMNTSLMNNSEDPIPMQLIMDGVFVEPNLLSSLNILDVESIEVLKSGAYLTVYGTRGGGGALLINMKKGKSARASNYTPGIITFKSQGLYKSREYYNPNHDGSSVKNTSRDSRSTIYWNPNVLTDSTGIAKFQYFNSDGTGTYKVVIEGIDLNGNIGRKVYRYNVK